MILGPHPGPCSPKLCQPQNLRVVHIFLFFIFSNKLEGMRFIFRVRGEGGANRGRNPTGWNRTWKSNPLSILTPLLGLLQRQQRLLTIHTIGSPGSLPGFISMFS